MAVVRLYVRVPTFALEISEPPTQLANRTNACVDCHEVGVARVGLAHYGTWNRVLSDQVGRRLEHQPRHDWENDRRCNAATLQRAGAGGGTLRASEPARARSLWRSKCVAPLPLRAIASRAAATDVGSRWRAHDAARNRSGFTSEHEHEEELRKPSASCQRGSSGSILQSQLRGPHASARFGH